MNSSAGLTCFCVSGRSRAIICVAMANGRIASRRICAMKASIRIAAFELSCCIWFNIEGVVVFETVE